LQSFKKYFEEEQRTTIALPKVKLDFARKSFYFLGASVFNSLPLEIKQIRSRVLVRDFLDHFLYSKLRNHSYRIVSFILDIMLFRQDPLNNNTFALQSCINIHY